MPNEKQKIKIRVPHIHLSKKQSLVLGGLIFILAYVLVFVLPVFVTYNFAGETCAYRPLLAPGIYKETSADYTVEPKGLLKIGSVPIMSFKQCITAQTMPKQGVKGVAYAPFGVPLFQYFYRVATPELPKLSAEPLEKPIPTSRPLHMALSAVDKSFTYAVAAKDKAVVECVTKEAEVICPIEKLGLPQGVETSLAVTRKYNKESVAVIEKTVTTLNATKLVDSTVKNETTVYDKPKEITLVFDKPLASMEAALYVVNGGAEDKVATKLEITENSKIRFTLGQDLEREKDYRVQVKQVVAADGSGLDGETVVGFRTSGGPAVSGSSAKSSGMAPGATVTISFDQPLKDGQDIQKFVSVAGGGARVWLANKQQVNVQLSMAKCADFTITVKKGLLSEYDVAQANDWSQNSRVSCHTVETIGYSVKGRAINAFVFGEGSATVMFVGAIHGSEPSSSYILQDLVAHLEANAKKIPAGKRVVIIPTINPDGMATGSRLNANKVNLNRNFATSDWKADINDTNGTITNGGGSAALSEPEANALAALSSRYRPQLVMSYHAVGSVAIANQAGNSAALAGKYAGLVGYSNGTGNSEEIFKYEITGTYDDWLREKLGTASIVVELGSYSYRNFEHHQAAMWAMIES